MFQIKLISHLFTVFIVDPKHDISLVELRFQSELSRDDSAA